MTPEQRLAAASEFFWRMADKSGALVTPQDAERLIRQLAESLPPFTRLPKGPKQ